MVAARLKQAVHGNPLGRGHFRVEYERRTRREYEDERSNRDWWEGRITGRHVVEAPEELLRDEVDPNLFARFPDHGGKEIRLFRFLPAAWQGHVAGPWIAHTIGTSYQEDGVGVRRNDDGHCGPNERGIDSDGWTAVGQAFLEAGEPAGQCE